MRAQLIDCDCGRAWTHQSLAEERTRCGVRRVAGETAREDDQAIDSTVSVLQCESSRGRW